MGKEDYCVLSGRKETFDGVRVGRRGKGDHGVEGR